MVTDGGEVIAGRYRLISRLGSGAMGVVWQAHDERLGRTVAVKQLRAPIGLSDTQIEQAHGRAQREARIAARLQHPNAVGVYDVVEHDGRPCMVMEYVPSRSLAQLLADGAVLPGPEVARIGVQLASALIAAHDAGIVHRDIKPGNILISDSGVAKLTDFGISRATGDVTVTNTGEMLGTPAYISPEVAQGRTAGAASDVFSLGATLYAAIEGTPPFGTGPNAMALLLRIVNGEVRQPENTGPLVDTVMWMLARDPEYRPRMQQVRRELESIVEETAAVIPPPEPEDDADDVAAEPETPAGAGPAEPADAVTAEVPEPSPSSSSSAPTAPARTTQSRPPSRWRSRLVPIAALIVVGVLTAAIVAAVTAHGGSNGSAGAPATTPAAQKTGATQAAGAIHTNTATTPTPTPKSTSTQTPTTAATTSTPTTAASSPTGSTTQQLSAAITSYYQLVPGNLDKAWNYLTAGYQQNTARGEANYKQFWGGIQSVSLTDLVATPPSTVVVTIDYFYKNGQTVQERTSFGLVFQDGIWKIATSSVLSSQTL